MNWYYDRPDRLAALARHAGLIRNALTRRHADHLALGDAAGVAALDGRIDTHNARHRWLSRLARAARYRHHAAAAAISG